jgi:hypothetical protein
MRFMLLAGIAMLFPGALPASAQEAPQMTVAAFIDRWTAMKASKDRPERAAEGTRLLTVVGEAAKRYKAELDADAKAGRPPRACPVKGSDDTFQLQEMVDALGDLPLARREGSFDAGFFDFLDKRHPCGGVSRTSP